jgi:hypothetical protein
MPSEAVYFSTRATVRFAIYPQGFEGPRVLAEISVGTLRDVFGARGDGDSLIYTYRVHFAKIQIKALTRYWRDPAIPVLLEPCDFDAAGTMTAASGAAGA